MASTKTIIIFCILITSTFSLLADDFEGRIVMAKQTPYDTTMYEFTVKGNQVKLNIENAFGQIIQSLIINLESGEIFAISPAHKLYTILKKNNQAEYNKAEYELIKTPNFKMISGYKCFLWHVRNKRQNSDITFWITETGFDFFPKVVKLLRQTEDYADLVNGFVQIEQNNTFFPILIVDRTLLKEEKSRMVVTKIANEAVNRKVFEIPENYQFLRY